MKKLRDYLSRIHNFSKKSKASILFSNTGFCYSCNRTTQFTAKKDWLRDHYVCDNCGSIPRERAVMYCIEKFFPDWRGKVIHESSPVFRGTSLLLSVPNFDTSFVVISRLRQGSAVYQAGLDHTYHRLVNLGWLSSCAVLTMHLSVVAWLF
jgi:hypothetical protein